MPSIMTVAREANVAVSTVSLALNHRDRVKPETRQRIEEVIERLGYRPRATRRRSLGESRMSHPPMRAAFVYTQDSFRTPGDSGRGSQADGNGHVGFRLPEDAGMSGYCRDIISGMHEAIAGSACSLSIFRGTDHVDHDMMVNEQIRAGEFDGVVVFGADPRNGYLDRFEHTGIPLVAVNHPSPFGRFSCVTLDYYGGAITAIDHICSLGHRRIAWGRNNDGKWLTEQIRAGTLNAFAKHGLKPAFEWDALTSAAIEDVCRQMLDAGATALFTGDTTAIRVVNAMESMGVRVPHDFSVIGLDDRGMQSGSGLKLTSVGYDKRRMGRMAIRMLQQLVQAKNKLQWQAAAVSTYLTMGQTTAKAQV